MPTSSRTAAGRTASTPTMPCARYRRRATTRAVSSTATRSGTAQASPSLLELTMPEDLLVDPNALRDQVRDKYREVALDPHRKYHFHTGRSLAARLGYDAALVDALPDAAVESFAGVGNPFSLR